MGDDFPWRTEEDLCHRKEVLLCRHVWEGQLVVQETISSSKVQKQYKNSEQSLISPKKKKKKKKTYKRNGTATAVKIKIIYPARLQLFVCFPTC